METGGPLAAFGLGRFLLTLRQWQKRLRCEADKRAWVIVNNLNVLITPDMHSRVIDGEQQQ